MKKIILLFTILSISFGIVLAAELPSKGYTGSGFSDGGSFMDAPTLGMGDRLGSTNSVLGDDACMDACLDALMTAFFACGGEPICEDDAIIAYTSCMDACKTYSLPIGSGFFFLLLLSGGYAGIKLRRKKKEA